MIITKIECIPVQFKYKRPHLMGSGVIPASEPVIVKIHTDEGITGIAEAGHTSLGYIGEGQASLMAIINEWFAPRLLLGADPMNIEKLTTQMDRMTKHNNQAITAIDFALHDLKGKKLGVPVYQLLGGLCNEKIPLGTVITFGPPDVVAEKAARIKKTGFRSIKLKVSAGDIAADIENIKAVREVVGDDFRLGMDANGGWDFYTALDALRKMEKYNLFMFEQPLPYWDIDGMARLRQKVGTPICADESATELSHLLDIIQKKAADAFFLKVARVGGMCKSQKWVAIAKAANIPVMCGCLTGSGWEAATQAHFIAGTEWMGRLEQENTGPLSLHDCLDTVSQPITDDLAVKVPRYEKGYLYPPDGPGLGMELNEELVQKLITPGKKPTVVEYKKAR
jgi:L-alanine-DL-glutamate epimerase-like enolase superfamily enzyme